MESPQVFWFALVLVVLVPVLLMQFLLLRRSRREESGAVLEQRLASLLEGQERARREILETATRGQAETRERLDQRLAEMQRALLLDAAGLKESLLERFEQLQKAVGENLAGGRLEQQKALTELKGALDQALAGQRESFEKRQAEAIREQQKALGEGMERLSRQLRDSLAESRDVLDKRVEKLTQTTETRLKEISGQVEKRLTEGFEKTTETFTRVLEHLSRIDEAQKKITELSGSVVSLQEVLADKRSRGAFGEVQLSALVRDLMPEGSFAFQHTLSNGTRVDCMLFLPEPTGKVPIDAKFPLESYQRMTDIDAAGSEREQARRQFRQDIRKHIQDISSKYLVPGETADGAVLFLPSESIFAEIHAHFPELVEEARHARVWLVSPTTLMAVLTTARAVIKDVATRKQVHIIKEHLGYLAKDFERFRKRMDNLARHIDQAHRDVQEVNTSARKISSRFAKIEKVELEELEETEEKGPLLPGQQEEGKT